ncbi:MAG: ABC transporter permease [Actinomycetota bacterium]|nr:ABC transporter permease [Actinomycetota bacterium]
MSTQREPGRGTLPDPSSGAEPGLSDAELAAVAPEVLADSLPEYFRAWGRRIRNGESGALPVVIALLLIVVFFQIEQSSFLTANNLVNLLVQAAIFILFGAAEIFVLLMSEIDLSVGFVAAVGGFVIAELIAAPVNLPWWVAILAGLLVTGGIGALQGTLITRLGLPSFVVTLGGLLGFEGVMLELANIDKTAVGGVINIDSNSVVYKLVADNMSPALGWIALVVLVALFAALRLSQAARRRSQGLSAPPLSVTALSIGATAAGGFLLVLVCNLNRGALTSLQGVPWVVPFVLVVLLIYSFFLSRTRTGRYIYAIGGNPEAARRAGINVAMVKTLGFALAGMTAGLAGLAYESRLGSMATDIDGGQLVLFGVAAAVIGGASLFGGRGRMLNALLGGTVIAVVFNGLGLMGITTAGQDIATALVLIMAVSLDALVRRRATVR